MNEIEQRIRDDLKNMSRDYPWDEVAEDYEWALAEIEALRAALREAMLFVLPGVGNGDEVIRRAEALLATSPPVEPSSEGSARKAP